MSLVAMFQKQKVSNSKKAFRLGCDHFGLMWNQASEEHKRLLLRAAFLQENPEPKPWGAYSREEKSTLHSFGLWFEEFADFQRVMKNDSKLREKRINAPD
ncbi:hypothetical protein ABCW44_09380 [Mannheimia haemolytica]|uniref:hypothetical protein n=1 Tax=Mannheimia haemolytica TaxID=75985 RepID=UPI003209AD01